MKMALACLADYHNITQEGKLNLLGIFNVLHPPALPYTHPFCVLAMSILFDADDLLSGPDRMAEVALVDPDGNVLFKAVFPVRVEGIGGNEASLALQIFKLRFTTKGDHEFRLRVGDLTHALPLIVVA